MKFAVMTSNVEIAVLRDMAQAAEGLGLELITFPDHLAYEDADGALDPHRLAYSSMILAAMVAESTRTLKFGQLVTNNLMRHPAVTAQAFMTLDRLSNGRLVAGMGAAWRELEFTMCGLPYPEVADRMDMLEESLQCIRSLWTNERTTFHGRHYRFDDAVLWPKPVQQPHPPFLLGGFAPKLLRLAAAYADYLNVFFPMGRSGHPNMARLNDAVYGEKVRYLRGETLRCGRDRRAVKVCNLLPVVAISESRTEIDAVRRRMAPAWGVAPELAHTSPHGLIGTPAECAVELERRARDWEIDLFMFSCTDPQALQCWVEQLRPYLSRSQRP
ncbi:MAG: LLM class flavin-dependent oxidoreductase [Gammaproteobacteria bacterium]